MKRVLLVNGVPASGKSTVARAVAEADGWPLLTLDTVKEAFFDHLGTGDRDYSRLLGKASYQAIFALIRDFPDGTRRSSTRGSASSPLDLLETHLASAGVGRVGEIWCHAPGESSASAIAQARARHAGHLGAAYVPELIELADGRARWRYPVFDVDTTRPLDLTALAEWLDTAFVR